MKKWFLLVLMISLLALAACDKIPFFNGDEKAGSQKGVELVIVDAPRSSLEEGEPFHVRTRVTNGNPTSSVNGFVCLSNPTSERLGGIPQGACEPFDLGPAEKVQEEIFPTQAEQSFGPFSYRNLDPDISFTTNIAATFTYLTQSRHFVPQVCVKRASSVDPPSGFDCDDIESYSFSITQPETPVQIRSIEREAHYLANNEVNVRFKIILAKTQEGDVVSRENIGQLVEVNPLIDFNIEYLGYPLQCSGLKGGRIEMSHDKKEISCRATVTVQQDYVQDPLVIGLAYGFRRVLQTDAIDLLPLDQEFAGLV